MIKNNISCTSCINSNCLIKKSCSETILDKIGENKSTRRIRKKQIIFQEGNEVHNIYFIHSGIVKVFKNGAFNKDQIIRFSINGNILGHRGLISSNTYPVSGQAIIDSEICSMPKDYFFELLNKVPQLSINLMFLYANELHQEETKLRDMAILNVREKVAKALLLLIDRFGLDKDNQISYIETLSRQDISESVGLSPNQATRILSEFKEDKLIEIKGKKIKIISKEKIEEIVSFLV